MAFQRVDLATFRSRLFNQLGSVGTFWSNEEANRAINEALAIWQALTGERVVTITQTIASNVNLVNVVQTATQGRVLSPLRVNVYTSVGEGVVTNEPSMRELSVEEMDAGFYGWRTEGVTATTQRPSYWAPVGVDKFFVYPRSEASALLRVLGYEDATPLSADTDYIDVDEGHLQKLLGMAQAILAFKQGVVEGTENASALKTLFLTAAHERNKELLKTSLYKNYMGHDDGVGEPAEPAGQQGVRG